MQKKREKSNKILNEIFNYFIYNIIKNEIFYYFIYNIKKFHLLTLTCEILLFNNISLLAVEY